MSRKVRMKFSFQGTRGDGKPWPAYNEVLETDDEGADWLVRSDYAVYLDDEPEPLEQGFAPLRKFSEDYDPALDPENVVHVGVEDEDNLEPDEDETPGPKRPYTTAKKEDWIAYAVAQGEDPDVAERMTKADLISKYGATLLFFS